jgi:hypothetical protein
MPTTPTVYRVVRPASPRRWGDHRGKSSDWERRLDQLADRAAQFLPLFEDGPPEPPTGRRSTPKPLVAS